MFPSATREPSLRVTEVALEAFAKKATGEDAPALRTSELSLESLAAENVPPLAVMDVCEKSVMIDPETETHEFVAETVEGATTAAERVSVELVDVMEGSVTSGATTVRLELLTVTEEA